MWFCLKGWFCIWGGFLVFELDLCFCGCIEWWVWFVFLFNFVPFWISWFSLRAGELSERNGICTFWSSRFSHFVYFRVSVNGSGLYVRFTVLKFGFRCSCYSLKSSPNRKLKNLFCGLNFFFLISILWFEFQGVGSGVE